jgi:hypothetical protein
MALSLRPLHSEPRQRVDRSRVDLERASLGVTPQLGFSFGEIQCLAYAAPSQLAPQWPLGWQSAEK